MNTVPIHTPSDEFDIPLSVPEIGGNEWKYIKECLDTGWVSSAGSFVERFQSEFATYIGARHSIAVANGTAALHVALRLVEVKPEDEVLVPDLTFVASVNAITYCQAHPILVDVDADDWQIDVRKVSRFLEQETEQRGGHCFNKRTGRRIRAVLPVHTLGLACRIEEIVEIARRHNLFVIEDAAEAVGVRYKGKHVGTFGDVGIFSFNGNKIMTTGGGGMVVTSDSGRAEYARYITTQAKDDPIEYFHKDVGYNYRLTNIQAALGVAQLERISEFIGRKREIADRYDSAFATLHTITRMPRQEHVNSNFWLYTLLLPPGTTLERRKQVLAELNSRGIGARPVWHYIHGLPPYSACQTVEIESSVRLYSRAICLPSSVGLTPQNQQKCIDTFMQVLESSNVRY